MSAHIYTDIAIFDNIFQKRTEFPDARTLEVLLREFQLFSDSCFILKSAEKQGSVYTCSRNWNEAIVQKGGCPATFTVRFDQTRSKKVHLTSKMLCHNHYGIRDQHWTSQRFSLTEPIKNSKQTLSASSSGGQFVIDDKPSTVEDRPSIPKILNKIVPFNIQNKKQTEKAVRKESEEFVLPDLQDNFEAKSLIDVLPDISVTVKQSKINDKIEKPSEIPVPEVEVTRSTRSSTRQKSLLKTSESKEVPPAKPIIVPVDTGRITTCFVGDGIASVTVEWGYIEQPIWCQY